MRFACDTGGTFTDLIVEAADGRLSMYKSATTPDDPVQGVLDTLALAAADRGLALSEFFGPWGHVHSRYDTRHQRHYHRHYRKNGAADDRGTSRRAGNP